MAIMNPRFFLVLTVLAVMCQGIVRAQVEGGKSELATIARYTKNGVEIRWIPDNKTILRLGFAHSYTIQRSENADKGYQDLARVKLLGTEEWDRLMAQETDTTVHTALEVARDLAFSNDATEQEISLDAGIAELSEQKSREDLIYAVFVLTTLRSGKTAEALGLGYTDTTVKEGQTYHYRVILNASSRIYHIAPGEITVKAAHDSGQYANEVFVYPGDQHLAFAWSPVPELSGYFVEKSLDGGKTYEPLNAQPFYASKSPGYQGPINGTFTDDSLMNYQWYHYRFYGLTAFNEKVLFAEVKGMPRDLTPPPGPLFIKQPEHVKPDEVLVGWEMRGNLSDLRGFIVARSDKDSGDFNILHPRLLPAETRHFTDTGFSAEAPNYYVVYALDTAGNISASYPGYVTLVDSVPPAQPKILSALIDSVGIVTITIEKGAERDLKGYRIFKSNSAEHEFSTVWEGFREDKFDDTEVPLVYTDTVSLNSLTAHVYYKIKALDFHYNQSGFSELIEIKRPDTIPPVTPVFMDVSVKSDQVTLHFAPSESEDVTEHIIYRKTVPEAAWDSLYSFREVQKTFIDTAVKKNTTYYYTLRAKDEGGLYSGFANPVYAKPYDDGVCLPVTNLTAGMDDRKVILRWDYPAYDREVFFIVYKKNEKGELRQYARTQETTFTDERLGKDNTYAVKVWTSNGAQSVLSDLVTARATPSN